MSKILLIGSTGLLGQALTNEALSRNIDLVGIARKGADVCADITDDKVLESVIVEHQPDIVINACAIVNHNLCETDKGLAYTVNARPSSLLSDLSKKMGFYYVYISTDGYYSGDLSKKHTETDDVLILNEYARTKYLGECFTLMNDRAMVVRTNIVGFRNNVEQPTFIEWAISAVKSQQTMRLFDDYYTSSISTRQFADVFFDLLKLRPAGVFNLASSEVSSKERFIRQLAQMLDLPLINPEVVSVKSLDGSHRADSLGLDVSKVETLLNRKLPNLEEVVSQLRKEYYALG